MQNFLFHTEFLVCPVEKQVCSVYGMKSELFPAVAQSVLYVKDEKRNAVFFHSPVSG